MQETQETSIPSLGQEDPLEYEMAKFHGKGVCQTIVHGAAKSQP